MSIYFPETSCGIYLYANVLKCSRITPATSIFFFFTRLSEFPNIMHANVTVVRRGSGCNGVSDRSCAAGKYPRRSAGPSRSHVSAGRTKDPGHETRGGHRTRLQKTCVALRVSGAVLKWKTLMTLADLICFDSKSAGI